ncbi:hypothetical+protein [Methylocapsa aurea]|uniref:hypothetical protein n=1 Tax=Methylocapsa aurea TaxID=663610 RepID=UPI003D18B445
MQLLTLGNGTSRAVKLQFEFGSGTYGLRIPPRDEIELQLPAEAIGAMLNQNQDIGLQFVDGGKRTPAGLWFKIGGGL